ncbi:hypothetical protein RJ641_008026 [Dillenia turbinata]|uniref:LysM domain-containing protein n=1 Tax=Dillenia turbinata TaxID=194707 RepID=A0AAN8VF18_9MAGN
MARSRTCIDKCIRTSIALADGATWFCAIVLVALILLTIIKEDSLSSGESIRGNQLWSRPCDEIYVVGEGETLHTISDKCGDPFIVERNPHIHDPDDVFPGLAFGLGGGVALWRKVNFLSSEKVTRKPKTGLEWWLTRPSRVAFLVLESATLCSSSLDCIGWRLAVTRHYPWHFLVATYFVFGFVATRFFLDKFFFHNLVIIENPKKTFLLGNYAYFLNEVLDDPKRAKKYFERAILKNLEDGNFLYVYVGLIWRRHKDASHAKAY